MNIAIFGAGAVGGYLGGKLSLATESHTVTLVARPRVAQAVRERGLILREGSAEHVTHPSVVEDASGLAPHDITLLTVRADDVAGSIEDVRPLLGVGGILVAFQNGVGTEEELAQAFGCERVIVATLTVSVVMEEPGVITRTSRAGGIALATMDGSPVPSRILGVFNRSKLPVVTVSDYRDLRWSKLLLNMLGAATSAILDVDMATLVADPRVFRMEQLAFREATRVMKAQGIRAVRLPGYPVPMAALVMRTPRAVAQRILGPRLATARSGRSPGSRADMKRGRSELDWYHGAVARGAEVVGVAAPVSAVLAELTRQLTANPEGRQAFRGNPEALIASLAQRGVRV